MLNLQSSEIKDYKQERKKYQEFVDTTSSGQKMLKGLKRDWKAVKKILSPNRPFSDFEFSWKGREIIPIRCDVLIIGGGAIGSSIAYWLKEKMHREDFSVVVIERDPTVRYLFTRIL